MAKRKSLAYSLWFSTVMAAVSVGMLLQQLKLMVSSPGEPQVVVALLIWLVLSAFWLTMFSRNLRRERNKPGAAGDDSAGNGAPPPEA